MAPKRSKKVNDNKYVLIWWIVEGTKTITELSKIPKTKREKNVNIQIRWEGSDGKRKNYFAKIIEFGATIEQLDRIKLDNKGNICDENTKMLSETIVQQKKVIDVSKKIEKQFEKKNKNETEKEIDKQAPIFSIDDPSFYTNRDKKIKFKTTQKNKTRAIEYDDSKILPNTASIKNNNSSVNFDIDKSDDVNTQYEAQFSITACENQYSSLSNVKNSIIDEIDLQVPTENGLGLSSIWTNDYFSNWAVPNTPVIEDFRSLVKESNIPPVMSSDLLELKSSNEDCTNPLLSYSDQIQLNRKENAGIFRPWSLSSNISTTFHPITENKSTKELHLEPLVLAEIDTSGNKSNVFEITEKNSNIGSMVTFLKNEVRETDVTFIQMVAAALTRIYESNERYNRHSSKVFEIPEFYTQPGDGMIEIAKNSKIFFPLHVKNRIEMSCQGNNDWETIVKSLF
ncbi:uncharacterized protein LOC123263804 [Cotesia glomerata]|uniref:uncharacterized protein LOC123263804 n=1 Tax=Cotesia glomerata TaxID=32391 RepID=UPI001D029093|nr:uncharacterized protein LOC123263804 [Cotesia glomerata]XP_044582718.1 uncharacterized protein LOC123263804 [Cotesia glomerata]XP_044582719.1 uncharacterized protein LOC123263804 [Cotesia glomerata]